MSTGYENTGNPQRVTFKSIDQGVKAFNNLPLASEGAVQTAQTRPERLVAVYAAARPIIAALSAVTLIPKSWREVLSVFMSTLDEVSATFKAGKDLATAPVDGTPQADIEPKLPVG